jgi:hypothetical protein
MTGYQGDMRIRIITTLGGAIVLGIWIYGEEKGGTFLGGTTAGLCALAFALGVGAFVGRWWILFALIGPLAALGYLEASGFAGGAGDWAREPLLSPPGIAALVWLGAFLLLGTQLGNVKEWIREAWR